MFAPAHHPAMKNVGPTRVELGTRTIFNLLGPLSNPAGVKRQMVGVFSKHWVEPLAQVLEEPRLRARLGRAWLRRPRRDHDDRPDHVAALENGKVKAFEITPEDVGLARGQAGSLRGGDADANAAALQNVLQNKQSPYRDIAVLNAAAALVVAGAANDLKDGVALAQKSIDSGEAKAVSTG